jgi:hypothetical protein
MEKIFLNTKDTKETKGGWEVVNKWGMEGGMRTRWKVDQKPGFFEKPGFY